MKDEIDTEVLTETAVKLECFCHKFPIVRGERESGSFSYCGVPRSEQETHGIITDIPYDYGLYCRDCGNKNCPECNRISNGGT